MWVLAGLAVVTHLAATHLGFHRDELYFIAASKRLTPSYVDFQPAVPVLVRAVRAVLGDSLLALRVVPSVAAGASVLLAGLIARELGGQRRAQLFAAFALFAVPLYFGMFTALNTVGLETVAWMAVALAFLRLLRTEDQRWWLGVGLAVGAALLVKFTVLAYLLGVAVAIVATRLREHLRAPWPWLGGAVALLAVAPSLVWQIDHGLPVAEFVRNQSTGGRIFGLSGRAGYLVSLALLPGPAALFVWIPGLRLLFRRPAMRALGVMHAAALSVFLLVAGKGYYAAPGIAVLLAAGSVGVAGWSVWPRRAVVIALAVPLLLAMPLLVPGVVPTSVLREQPDLAQATEISERIGWPDLARTVSDVAGSLPPNERERAIVIGSNYTLSAAVEYYASRYDLPPAVSGHNSAYLWWPDIPDDHVALVIGYDRRFLERLYSDVRKAGVVSNRAGVEGYDWGKPIWIARAPRVDPATLRSSLKLFTA